MPKTSPAFERQRPFSFSGIAHSKEPAGITSASFYCCVAETRGLLRRARSSISWSMATLLNNRPDTSTLTPPVPPRPSLAGMTKPELLAALEQAGVAPAQTKMRATQLWNWIYARGARDFAELTNVSKQLRSELDGKFTLARPEIAAEQISEDGTRKWLLRLEPQNPGERAPEVEAVYIPEPDRGTLCISSQVGCTLTCTFCHTGTQRLVRNLTASEIIGQILVARDRIGDWPGADAPADTRGIPESERKITNIVLMGMGEPLYNFENVKAAMAVAADPDALSFSKRRITLSTSGVVPIIGRAGAEMGVMLAISLHAVRDELRDELVPINRKYPIAELLHACRNYPGLSNARRITFEYVMLKGVNDSVAEAKELVRLLAGIPAKINLIPFNPWPGTRYECSAWAQIERFADVVNRAGYASPIRTPRGRDIMAACGQLKSASEKLRASALRQSETLNQAN
jgi:23S rRNA (adenine2503-C2)-methyltransferase